MQTQRGEDVPAATCLALVSTPSGEWQRLVAVGRSTGALGLWNRSLGRLEGSLDGLQAGSVAHLATLTPLNRVWLAAAHSRGSLRLWDVGNRTLLAQWSPVDAPAVGAWACLLPAAPHNHGSMGADADADTDADADARRLSPVDRRQAQAQKLESVPALLVSLSLPGGHSSRLQLLGLGKVVEHWC